MISLNLLGQKGQATIELLIILIVLFGILMFSVRLFADQRASVNQQEIQNGAQRTGMVVAQAVTSALSAPIGSAFRVFIPPGPASQTIRVRGGFVEVQSEGQLALVTVPDKNVVAGPFGDANTYQFSRTLSGVRIQ